jgi:hypothetical protein
MSGRGKCYAVITILLGCAAIAMSVYVLCTCEFYEVAFTNSNGRAKLEMPGIYLCKYRDRKDGETFAGPTNGFDKFAMICGFAGGALGLIGTFLVMNSYWKCFCKVKNAAAASCILMMAFICQALTLLVLVTEACREENDGDCKLMTNAWISVASACTFFLASSFAREVASGNHLPKE